MSEENNNPNVSEGPKDNTKLYSILAYIGILFLVGLLADKENPVVRFHVNQGLILFLANLILWCVFPVWIVFMVLGIMNAAKGEMKPLPLIGGIKIIK